MLLERCLGVAAALVLLVIAAHWRLAAYSGSEGPTFLLAGLVGVAVTVGLIVCLVVPRLFSLQAVLFACAPFLVDMIPGGDKPSHSPAYQLSTLAAVVVLVSVAWRLRKAGRDPGVVEGGG